ncbi:hypothetical protein [Streptomyces sp. NBC_00102]|uniref:hypothetical protein n=1 Tax=Streptomyces sp. NBC_00102 TaxID=2975652 RepID=UPI00224F869A|nr:hypothetical protein [Streptomyces sp. NBC_00102]MCX5400965.1 hypothetical protein [Streptomyces sp. NBC_00102]
MSEDEYCLHVNAREGALLWMILADRAQSEDEGDWIQYVPVFAKLIECWSRKGFVRLFRGTEFPVDASGEEVPIGKISDLLGRASSWAYVEEHQPAICVVLGDRDLVELEEGMCD